MLRYGIRVFLIHRRVVSRINSDTSGFFKAAIGRDATPNTSTNFFQPNVLRLGIPQDEETAIKADSVVREDANLSLRVLAGFQGNERTTLRLKQISEQVQGVGDHIIRVWDGSEIVWRRTYEGATFYTTPLTITFSDLGSGGLSAHKGNSLVVESLWDSSITVTDEATTNLSIIVGHWTE